MLRKMRASSLGRKEEENFRVALHTTRQRYALWVNSKGITFTIRSVLHSVIFDWYRDVLVCQERMLSVHRFPNRPLN